MHRCAAIGYAVELFRPRRRRVGGEGLNFVDDLSPDLLWHGFQICERFPAVGKTIKRALHSSESSLFSSTSRSVPLTNGSAPALMSLMRKRAISASRAS